MLMKVYVVVRCYEGVEDETRVFWTREAAEITYCQFAQECGVPYDEEMQDYDWSHSKYSAWWSECEVEE